MLESEHQLQVWMEQVRQYRLPRWEELPDIELYMDQVITLIERYLTPLVGQNDNKIITAAMINNYVKLDIMPKPFKKRYERVHLAHLIVITILKQILLIPDVKEGIFLQSKLCTIPEAYNIFCEEQERTLRIMADQYRHAYLGEPMPPIESVELDHMGMHMACMSFAGKVFAEQIIVHHLKNHPEADTK